MGVCRLGVGAVVMMWRNYLMVRCNYPGVPCQVTRTFNLGQLAQLSGCECSVTSKHLWSTFKRFELAKASNVQILHIAVPDRPVKVMPASRQSADVN